MPQVVVVVNKIDRPAARPDWVVDSTYELFMDLGATDEQVGQVSKFKFQGVFFHISR